MNFGCLRICFIYYTYYALEYLFYVYCILCVCMYNIFSVQALQAYAFFVNSIKSVPIQQRWTRLPMFSYTFYRGIRTASIIYIVSYYYLFTYYYYYNILFNLCVCVFVRVLKYILYILQLFAITGHQVSSII